jgi:hypothetical protein
MFNNINKFLFQRIILYLHSFFKIGFIVDSSIRRNIVIWEGDMQHGYLYLFYNKIIGFLAFNDQKYGSDSKKNKFSLSINF